MGKTPIYKLGYIEPRQKTAEIPTLDRERFETMERQLKWLFSLFGNGIIEDDPVSPSWRIQNVAGDTSGTQVQITAGRGHVAWKSAVTTAAVVVNLPAPPNIGSGNQWAYWLYAEADSTTHYRQTVRFFASNTEIDQPDRYVGLGGVIATLGSNGITLSPQNTTDYGRTVISLFSVLAEIINKHKHIGGSNNPSPINLGLHVQGKLSGDFIEDLNLNDVTEGTLAPERLPVISHKDLSDIGTLEHKEIDSLLAAIEIDSDNRLSDLFGVNYMQIVLAEKKIDGRDDIDADTIAALFYVPGVTPDSYVAHYDNYASYGLTGVEPLYVPDTVALATIDKVAREIRGSVTSPISSDAIAWVSRRDFDDALDLAEARTISDTPLTQHIEVTGDEISGGFTIERPLNYDGVVTAVLNDFSTGYKFTDRITKLPVTPPNTSVADDYDVRRHLFTEFASSNDWSEDTKLAVGYSLSPDNDQGDIYMYLILESGGTAEEIRLTDGTSKTLMLSQLVKIHSRDDPPGEALIAVKNLLEFTGTTDLLVKVAGLGFVWDTETGWDRRDMTFALAVPGDDDIPDSRVVDYRAGLPDYTSAVIIWNDLYYAPTGRLVLRFDSNYDLTQYDTIGVTTTASSQTRILTRVSDTEEGLEDSTRYPLTSGYVSASGNTGRWVDVIVELQRSTDRLTAPFVDDITLSFRSPGASQSKVWDRKVAESDYETVAAWEKATRFLNVVCDPDTSSPPNSLTLLDSGDVGQWLFARGNTIYSDFEVGGDPEEVVQDGSALYFTPIQVWNGSSLKGFRGPTDASEQDDGRWVIADTENDRVLSVNQSGDLIQAVQGNLRLRKSQRAWAALTAIYNPRLGKLWVAFSQNTTVSDKTKMSLVSDLDTVSFSGSDVNVVLFGADSEGKSATFEVRFSSALVDKINAWTSSIRLVIGDGAVANAGVSGGDEKDPGGGEGGDDGGNSSGGGSDGGGRSDGGDGGGAGGLSDCGLPDYLTSDLYRIIGTGEFALTTACPLSGEDGLAPPAEDSDDGVFDPAITSLQGPGAQVGQVILDVFSGEVVFDNLYGPVSVQETATDDWVVGTSGNRSVIGYGPSNVRAWTISSTTVAIPEGLGGSAYELDSGNILVAAPVEDTDQKGRVVVVNRESNNTPVITLQVSGDPVRAIPDPDGVHFWVAIHDRIGDGRTSRLARMTAAGVTDWLWGIGILVHPRGLRYMENGDLLVSE